MNSKYQKKLTLRRKEARKLGLRRDATWPEIWAKQYENEIGKEEQDGRTYTTD